MVAKKVYLTKERLAELKNEHDQLVKVKRPEVVDRVSTARAQGDLSENAEYQAARDELSFLDGRIAELEEILKQAEIIEDSGEGKKMVGIGCRVVVKIDGSQVEFMIVGEWEADPASRKISHESPLGKALVGKAVGDTVEVEAPAGKINYTIVGIH